MQRIKEFIGNEPDQVVEPDKQSGDKEDVPTSKRKTRDMRRHNPKKYVNVKPALDEAVKKDTAVISFGRMNPVTAGHEVLINKVISTAASENGDPLVYLSHSTDSKKNPLTYDQKINFAKKAFGKVIQKSSARTIIDVAKQLQSSYNNLVVVVGSDRVGEFKSLLTKYNGKDYNFKSIEVVSAGERDPDADDVTGMSASKMRALAKDNDMNAFKKGLPKKLKGQAKTVFNAVKKGMNEELEENKNHRDYKAAKKAYAAGTWDGNVTKDGNPIVFISGKPVIVEDLELDEALTRQQRLKRKMLMRRMKSKIAAGRRRAARRRATMDTLKSRARRQVIRKLKQRFAKSRDYQDLPYSARQRIDDRVAKIPSSRIDILMRRMLPSVKAKEKQRLANRIAKSSPSNPVRTSATVSKAPRITENFNAIFESFIESRNIKTDVQRAVELAEALGGNQNYAIKEIEKISKGISKHYQVKEALLRASENFSEKVYTEYTLGSISEGPTYHTGLAKSTADKRKAQFKKQAKMDDDNPAAYKPAPGDKRSETKPSQHTNKFKQMFGESTNREKAFLTRPHLLLKQDGSVKLDKRFKMFKKQAELDEMTFDVENLDQLAESVEFIFESNPKKAIQNKAEKTGISYGILKKVFDRGVAAWRTGHRPGTTPTQWGLARINSFATGGKTRTTADKDLWAQHKGKKND